MMTEALVSMGHYVKCLVPSHTDGHICFFCLWINTLRLRQNGRHFADDTFKPIFLNENIRISIKISQKFVPKVPINNIPALVQIMAWRRPGDKPLSEPKMVRLPMHICITRPQWVNIVICGQDGCHLADNISKDISFDEKLLILNQILIKRWFYKSDWQHISIDWGNSLGVNKWQDTNGTKSDQVALYIYDSPDFYGLRF